MKVRYVWSGTVNQFRFALEIMEIAILLGAQTCIRRPNYLFPEGNVPTSVVRWLNEPYGVFSIEETKTIWEHIRNYPRIRTISPQVWEELRNCAVFGANWHID